MLTRYHAETVSTPKPPPEIPKPPKPTKKRPFKPLRFVIPLLLIAVLGIAFGKIKLLSLTCLDQALSLRPDFKLARFCSKFSPLPSSSVFFNDLDNVILAAVSPGTFNQDSLTRLQTSIGRLNESSTSFYSQLNQISGNEMLKTKLTSMRPLISQLAQLSPQLPKLLAVNSKVSYLILVQDSTELRSTGGYLDTLAYFTVSNARITSSRYFSSSTLPTQIRNANSNPDFPTVAKDVSRLFTRSTSLPVDYVVAVNLTTLSTLQNKTISSYLDKLSRSGSVNLYFSDLMSSLPTSPQIDFVYFLLSQLQSRQIYLFPSIPGWDGSLSPPTCRIGSCLSDFLIPVENHLGLNKGSAYLVRSVILSQSFSAGRIQSEYRLTLKNTSPSSVWPAGTVKNYVQFFLPPASVVDSGSAGYSVTGRPGFSVVSFFTDTPPGQTRDVFIKYHQPLSPSQSHYRFTFLPQPGLLNMSFAHTLTFPQDWSVTAHQSPVVAQPGRLQYNSRNPNPYILDLDITQ